MHSVSWKEYIMNNLNTSIMVVGSGNMGSAIIQALKQASIPIFQVVNTTHPPHISKNKKPSMIIDFSHPDCLYWIAPYIQKYHIPFIGGTTGYKDDQLEILLKLSHNSPVFYDTNYSLGIALLKKMIQTSASLLTSHFQIEISELHHQKKKDSPSGTAKQLQHLLEAFSNDTIPIHSIRGGSSPGTHTIYFLGNGEELIFQHISHQRSIFTDGILQAITFLEDKTNGFYTMNDIC